ncbi:MAG: hypothetical protein U0172_11060 [Nitrospiraceae bacterium]
MGHTLYLMTKAVAAGDPLLPPSRNEGSADRAVLLQDAVRLKEVPFGTVFVLGDDLKTRGVSSAFNTIDYPRLLEEIFAADYVIRV